MPVPVIKLLVDTSFSKHDLSIFKGKYKLKPHGRVVVYPLDSGINKNSTLFSIQPAVLQYIFEEVTIRYPPLLPNTKCN